MTEVRFTEVIHNKYGLIPDRIFNFVTLHFLRKFDSSSPLTDLYGRGDLIFPKQ